MIEGKFSKTAFGVARRRAAHQLFDDPKVLNDPLALQIVGAKAVSDLLSGTARDDRFSRALRAFLAARSRFAEDELEAALQRGVTQYVVLGAGLDTSAYRAPVANGALRVFEIDHPATQLWKRERLASGDIPVPANLTFVPVDFESQKLTIELAIAGFQENEPSFFSWLGVTPYLTLDAFLATVEFISGLPASQVVFDYAVDSSVLKPFERVALQALSARVAWAGEPFRLFFKPEDLEEKLRVMGFTHIQDLDKEAINARYFRDRRDGLQISGGLGQLMSARR